MRLFSRRLKKAAVAFALTATFVATASAQTGGKPEYVGDVVDIDGPVLKTNRLKEGGKWYQAYPTMKTYFKERLASDASTTATIDLAAGGVAVISPGTTVEMLKSDVMKVSSGTVWAKFDKEKLAGQDKKFEIRTAGGVMGIEGTEFMVTTDPQTKQTKLVVVEGTVDVGGTKVTPGKEASFGTKAVDVAEYIAYNSPESAIRDAAFGRLSPGTSSALRPIVDQALWYVPGRYRLGRFFYGRGWGIARNVVWAVRDPQGAAISMISSEVPVGGGILGGALRKATEPAKRPEGIKFQNGTFTWDGSKRSDRYAVIMSTDSENKDVLWYGVTDGDKTKLTYPSYGPAIAAGTYVYVTVSSLDKEGKPRANKENGVLTAQTGFTSDGHTPVFGAINGVGTTGGNGTPPTSNWQAYKGANTYRVSYRSGEETVWAADTQDLKYTLPSTARGFEPGDYAVKVEAFDPSGLKMAESSPATFAATGWESTGLDGPAREAGEGASIDRAPVDLPAVIAALRNSR